MGSLTQNDSDNLESLYETRKELEKKLSLIKITLNALDGSHEKIKKSFTPALNKKASEYFGYITDNKYSRIFCDEGFNISVEADLPRESAFFSGGTIDQLYLSLRMALIDMMFPSESMFIILDQPFMQYDTTRSHRTLKLLESLSDNRQILLFLSDADGFSSDKQTQILT